MRYFSYFPNCPLIEGASHSAFYDLRTSAIIRFPSALLPKLRALNSAEQSDIESSDIYPDLGELADSLISLGVAAYTARRSPWIEIASAKATVLPTHAVIDVGDHHHDYPAVFEELAGVGCEFIQVRMFHLQLSEVVLVAIAEAAHGASLRGVELIAPFTAPDDLSWLAPSLEKSPQISGVTFHSAQSSAKSNNVKLKTGQHIQFEIKRFRSSQDCGSISQESICAPTVANFRKLQISNGCHAGKVGIDALGHIRNCPASKQSFGLVGEKPLEALVLDASFQSTWLITKDAIEGCKDCEFRYACTDCRVFIAGSDVTTAKPSKCSYDPYTGYWNSDAQS